MLEVPGLWNRVVRYHSPRGLPHFPRILSSGGVRTVAQQQD